MSSKKEYYWRFKKNLEEAEKNYNNAIEKLKIAVSQINRGIIHGRKEQAPINSFKAIMSEIMRTSLAYELATYQLHSFLEKGIISYE